MSVDGYEVRSEPFPVVVLSGPILPGGMISHDTLSRLEKGVDTAENMREHGMDGHLVLVGGSTKLMQDALWKRGTEIPDDSIHASARYRDTVGNALDAKPIIVSELGARCLRLTTAEYHMPRAWRIFGQVIPKVNIIPNPSTTPCYSAAELESEIQKESGPRQAMSNALLFGYNPKWPLADSILAAKLRTVAAVRNFTERNTAE